MANPMQPPIPADNELAAMSPEQRDALLKTLVAHLRQGGPSSVQQPNTRRVSASEIIRGRPPFNSMADGVDEMMQNRDALPPMPAQGNPLEPGMDPKGHEDLVRQGAVHTGGGNYLVERDGQRFFIDAQGRTRGVTGGQARTLTAETPLPGATMVVDAQGNTVNQMQAGEDPGLLAAVKARLMAAFGGGAQELPDSAVRRIPRS